MPPAARTVRRLRLRAPSEAAVRDTVRMLEEALRTATLPDAGGRILFVRRLALGRLPPHAQPVSVALALEEAVARIGVEWRHGDDAGADAASAVWFRDALEAHVALARRLLAGQVAEAWYWPLAVPLWNRWMTGREGVRTIARSLATRPEAPVALPRWFVELVDAGYAGALAAALPEGDVEVLARAAGVRMEETFGRVRSDVRRESGDTPFAGSATGAAHRLMEEMLRAGSGDGARRPLYPFDVRHAGTAARPISTPPRGARAPTDQSLEVADAAGGDGSPCLPELPPEAGLPYDGGDRQGGSSLTSAAQGGLEEGGSGEARVEREGVGVASLTSVPGNGSSRYGVQPTGVGGLLFLLHALERAGYVDWITRQPEWNPHQVARRVLGRVLVRLAIGEDDPVWDAVRVHSLPAASPRRFMAPPRWRDGLLAGRGSLLHAAGAREGRLHDPSGRLLLAAWRGPCPRALLRDRRAATPSPAPPGDLVDEVVGAWETAVRRWLRRFATVGVSDVALRRAGLAITPTHIDVHFNLGAADPRIRRAGLDLDPGWIAWFGRVVAFHYDPGGPS